MSWDLDLTTRVGVSRMSRFLENKSEFRGTYGAMVALDAHRSTPAGHPCSLFMLTAFMAETVFVDLAILQLFPSIRDSNTIYPNLT